MTVKQWYFVLGGLLALVLWVFWAHAADVAWSRFRGTIKAVNHKTGVVTLQNKDGDVFNIKVDADVTVVVGKEERAFKDVRIDDKVTLLYAPKVPLPKEADDPDASDVYPPFKK